MKTWLKLIGILFTVLLFTGCSGIENQLEKELKSPDPAVRREAAAQLAEVATPRALQLLEMDRDDPDFRVRDEVRKAIAEINKRTFMK